MATIGRRSPDSQPRHKSRGSNGQVVHLRFAADIELVLQIVPSIDPIPTITMSRLVNGVKSFSSMFLLHHSGLFQAHLVFFLA
jgi:hypothetical protein